MPNCLMGLAGSEARKEQYICISVSATRDPEGATDPIPQTGQ